MHKNTGPEKFDSEASPFLDSIKRIGHQARHWETTTDFGSNLDILMPSNRRRLVFSPRLLIGVVGLLAFLTTLQTVLLYRELSRQEASIERLQSMVAKILSQQSQKQEFRSRKHL